MAGMAAVLEPCRGIRVRGTGQPARENTPQTLDADAVSDGKVLYLFTLRNQVDYYKKTPRSFRNPWQRQS